METERNEVIRAAQYVRMSTEHQQYSTQNQREKILEYAAQHNIEIVRTYADDGKSGLSIGGRPGLRTMIADIEKGDVDFSLILIYDVSRWGRFQDADESAYWEYRIKQTGIRIRYTAEQFDNDGSPVSTIVKGVKRAMAGEYSRELSAKTFIGLCNIVRRGFCAGGPPGLGYRRQLIDIDGNPKGLLETGERKCIQTDRVVMVPGPSHEIELIRLMFHWYVEDECSYEKIADRFNQHPLAQQHQLRMHPRTVPELLFNERYIGTLVYNKTSEKLKGRQVNNPRSQWVITEHAFEGIVPEDLFRRAQERRGKRLCRLTSTQLLDRLREAAKEQGPEIHDWSVLGETFPRRETVLKRLGGVNAIYISLGISLGRVTPQGVRQLKLTRSFATLIKEISAHFSGENLEVDVDEKRRLFLIGGKTRVKVHILFQQEIELALNHGYKGHFPYSQIASDLILWVVIDAENLAVKHYYVIPTLAMGLNDTRVYLCQLREFECFRCADLQSLCQHLREVRIASVSTRFPISNKQEVQHAYPPNAQSRRDDPGGQNRCAQFA